VRRRLALALTIFAGFSVAVPEAGARRKRRPKARKVKCDSSRYGCVGKNPKYYDKLVRRIFRPAKGQDRACLKRLKAAGIKFRMLANVKGVKTPVLVLSRRLGRVLYRKSWSNKRRFILDCQMVEVLAAMGPEIRRAGIASIYYSSSWRYSIIKGGRRLSKHAYGKALDITAVDGSFGYASVIRNYERGKWGCGSRNKTPKGKAWRSFYCALKKRHAFRTIFTPDTDRLHRDHYHVDGPNWRIRLKPRPKRRRRRRH
jgi:hypothetical protein